jgi:hypothetical protein
VPQKNPLLWSVVVIYSKINWGQNSETNKTKPFGDHAENQTFLTSVGVATLSETESQQHLLRKRQLQQGKKAIEEPFGHAKRLRQNEKHLLHAQRHL